MKSKKRAAFTIFFAVLAIVNLPLMVLAQEDTTTTNEDQTKTLEQRLSERKAAFDTKLTTAQLTRLKARCKASQALLGPVRTNFLSLQKSRVNVYDKVENRLNELVAKIGDQADTTELKDEIIVLSTMIDDLEQTLADYKQVISDLIEMDCVADAEAFQASLEEARSLLASLHTKAKSIRSYITDTIKPSLQAVRIELSNQSGGSN